MRFFQILLIFFFILGLGLFLAKPDFSFWLIAPMWFLSFYFLRHSFLGALALFFYFSSVWFLYLEQRLSFWLIFLMLLFITFLATLRIFKNTRFYTAGGAGGELPENNISDNIFLRKGLFAGPAVFGLLITFLMAQIFWTVSFLPFEYLQNGAIFLIIYFTLIILVNLKIKGELNKKTALNYIFLSMVCLTIIFTSALLLA